MTVHVFCIYQLRLQIKQWMGKGGLKNLLLDGLFAFELGCVAQEQGIILQYYGLLPWGLCLFCVVVWQVVAWPGRSASPIPYLLTFSLFGLLRSCVMLVASLSSYRYMSWIWQYQLTHFHQGRELDLSLEKCSFPFLKHSFTHLCATEFLGSLVLTAISIRLFSNRFLVNNDPFRFIRGCIMAAIVLAAVLLGMDISGAMYNPTLATLLLGGCKGQQPLDHLLVYWIAPTAGAWAASKLVAPSSPSPPSPAGEKKKTK